MEQTNPKIGVTALCPGFVHTDLATSERNAPQAVKELADEETPEHLEVRRRFSNVVGGGISPDVVAERAVAAIRERRLYVLTHPEYSPIVRQRYEDILDERNLDRYNAAYDEFSRWQAEQAQKQAE